MRVLTRKEWRWQLRGGGLRERLIVGKGALLITTAKEEMDERARE